jgi:hypothetical protein
MQEATEEEHGPEPAQKGPGPADPVGSAQGPFGSVRDAFALGVRLFIASAAVDHHIQQIILLTPFTRKPMPQDEGES